MIHGVPIHHTQSQKGGYVSFYCSADCRRESHQITAIFEALDQAFYDMGITTSNTSGLAIGIAASETLSIGRIGAAKKWIRDLKDNSPKGWNSCHVCLPKMIKPIFIVCDISSLFCSVVCYN
jgi:hypothetical protein